MKIFSINNYNLQQKTCLRNQQAINPGHVNDVENRAKISLPILQKTSVSKPSFEISFKAKSNLTKTLADKVDIAKSALNTAVIQTEKDKFIQFVEKELNIACSSFYQLEKLANSIKPVYLPLAKGLTEFFKKRNIDDFMSISDEYKKLISEIPQNSRKAIISNLNKKNLSSQDFLKTVCLAKLFKLDSSLVDVYKKYIYSDNEKEFDVNELFSKMYFEYSSNLISKSSKSENTKAKEIKFRDKVIEYIRKNGDELDPFMYSTFISTINPKNAVAIRLVCSQDGFLDLGGQWFSDTVRPRVRIANILENYKGDFKAFLELLEGLKQKNGDVDLNISILETYLRSAQKVNLELNAYYKVVDWYEKIQAKPERYTNEDDEYSPLDLFEVETYNLALIMSIFDDQTLDVLFSRHMDNVYDYLNDLDLDKEDVEVLKKLVNCKTPEGKELTTTEKLNLAYTIPMLEAPEQNYVEEMANKGIINIQELPRKIFYRILETVYFDEDKIADITDEQIKSWDNEYFSLVAQAINEDEFLFGDLFKASLSPNFLEFIHNVENSCGESNSNTKDLFKLNKFDYEKWVKPSKENEVKFLAVDKNLQKLKQIELSLLENIEAIRNTNIKKFFDKRYAEYIKDDKFVLPEYIADLKESLMKFIKNLQVQLSPVWKRAEENSKKENSIEARNMLTIKSHIDQIEKDFFKISNSKIEKTLDLTIKMWDRYPQKDLFQGNYSTCCIKMGGTNAKAMPIYLLNTAFNMIELVDNNSGNTIGNALCYFAKDAKNKPIFILDNIEINNNHIPSAEVSKELLCKIKEYASNVAKEVTGENNIPIYLGVNYNDIDVELPEITKEIEFLGDFDAYEIYLDVFGGWIDRDETLGKVSLCNLNCLK